MEAVATKTEETSEMRNIPLNLIALNNYNARNFENQTPERKAAFEKLVASVREKGVIQPILLRPIDSEDGEARYEVMAGERRYRAACQVGLANIPAVIKVADDDAAFDMMTIENHQRENLTPVEEARSFKAALEKYGDTPDTLKDLSKRWGVTPAAIRLRVALLDLPEAAVAAWEKGEITSGHAEELGRLVEEKAVLEALTETLRRKFTVKELGAWIKDRKPPMTTAKFDTGECAFCVSNGAIQMSIFKQETADGACLQPACFKMKQEAALKAQWSESKAKAKFGTNGFRFQEDLKPAEMSVITAENPAQRCLECPEFVSIITVTVKGVHGRACIGKRECYDELYNKPEEPPKGKNTPGAKPAPGKSSGSQPTPKNGAGSSSKDDAKRASKRGQEFREKFLAEAIPAKVKTIPVDQPPSVKLALIGLLLASDSARKAFIEANGLHNLATKEAVVQKVFALDGKELLTALQEAAIKPIMEQESEYRSASSPQVRSIVAEKIGIDLKAEWTPGEDYFKSMTKAEIVKVGDEVGLWEKEPVKSYRDKNFGEKGWMSLKKGDLIDCIMKSGADLVGLTPKEILEGKG